MKLTIVRESLLQGLQPLMQVSGRSSSSVAGVAKGQIRLTATGNQLHLVASDGETEIESSATTSAAETGVALVPARKLFEIIRGLRDGAEIDVHSDGSHLSVSTPGSKYRLSSLATDQFPTMASSVVSEGKLGHVEISERELKRMFGLVSHAMGKSDVRGYLNGMLLHVSNKAARFIATDGHRLAGAKLQNVECDDCKIIIPNKAVHEINALIHESDDLVRLTWSENCLRVDLAKLTYQTRLVGGVYPKYEEVIPSHAAEVTTDRLGLLAAVQRALILSNPISRSIAFILDGDQVGVQANNPDQEGSVENVDASMDFPKMDIGFNGDYVVDALNSLKENESVRISVKDRASSILIRCGKNEHTIQVIMPVRL